MQTSTTERAFSWIDRRFGVVATLVVIAALALAVVGSASADKTEPSYDPAGQIYETAERVDEIYQSSSTIRQATFIIDRPDGGDVLTQAGLAEFHGNVEAALADPAHRAHLASEYDSSLGIQVDGVLSVAGAMDDALPAGVASATESDVKATLGRVLDSAAPTGSLRFTLASAGEPRTDGWSASAFQATVRYDLATFDGDEDEQIRAAEEWLRELLHTLRGSQDSIRVIGAGIDPTLTAEEQFGAGGPFIFLAVGIIVLLVGALLRSYWAAAVVTAALSTTLLAYNGLIGFAGIKFGSSLIVFVIPITLIAFGVDFFIHSAERVREAHGYPAGMRAVFPALTLAAATSVAAFLSNTVSGIEAIIEFGIASAVGLAIAYVVLGWLAPRAVAAVEARVGTPAPRRWLGVPYGAGFAIFAVVAGTTVAMAALTAPVGAAVLPLFAALFLALPMRFARRRNAAANASRPMPDAGRSDSTAVGGAVRFFARRRLITLPLVALIGGVGVYGATQVESAFQVSDFFSGNTDFVRGLDRLETHYGEATGGTAYVQIEGDLTDPTVLVAIESALADIAAGDAAFARDLDGDLVVTPNAATLVRTVVAAPGAADAVEAATGIAITDDDGDGLADTAEQVAAIYETARAEGVVAGDGTVIYTADRVAESLHRDADGDATRLGLLVTTFTDDALILEAREALDTAAAGLVAAAGGTATAAVSGDVITSQDSLAAFTDAMMVSLPIAIALTVVIVGLSLRSVRFSVVTIVPILLVVFGVWGYMAVRGHTINVVTATIAAIAVGVGIDFCTHFTVRYREELGTTSHRLDAIHRAGDGTGAALAVSAMTSIVGFGVMAMAPAPIFASFGELMAVMITMSAIAALFVLPSLLVVVTPRGGDVDLRAAVRQPAGEDLASVGYDR